MNIYFLISLLACVCLASVNTVQSNARMDLVLLTDFPDAVCLDGSPGAYYESLQPNSTKWMFWFQGGGWCYDVEGCLARSHSDLGSSKDYAKNVSRFTFGGPMSPNCEINPTFCDFNLIHIQYCDGASFSGNLKSPISVTNSSAKLFFRGSQIRLAVIAHLVKRGLLSSATEVLLGGESAGGLATYLHADSFRYEISLVAAALSKFRALPVSGYFLMHANYLYQESYATRMRAIFELSGAGNGGVNTRCLAALTPTGEGWRCMFAETVTPFIEVRTFALQSRMDAWSLPCILASSMELTDSCYTIPPFTDVPCPEAPPHWNLTFCFPGNLSLSAISYSETMLERVIADPLFMQSGSGIFLDSCFTHCEGFEDRFWHKLKVKEVVLRDAVKKWWESQANTTDSYYDCTWTPGSNVSCNPTC
jgi:hypothetical protein